MKNAHNRSARLISVDRLKEAVDYNAETGAITWRHRPASHFKNARVAGSWNSNWVGKPAFNTAMSNGYLKGKFNDIDVLAHRVAWLLISGEWPEKDIDHIDGDRSNNRAKNLRPVERSENLRNRGWRGNACGVIGVYLHKASGLYAARIYVNGRAKSLGYFDDIDDARRARIMAECKYGYHQNHGRRI